jgi:putative phage-type endonuclease
MLQRTKDWFDIREGRFTASQISRLLGKEGLKRTKDSIDGYAYEKAVEQIYGKDEDEDFISFDMQRGITQEPLAFALFKELKSYEFIDVKETGFHQFEKHAGASPDGLLSNNCNLEIKCPRRKSFFRLVANGIDEVKPDYVAQMQMQMLSTKTEKTHFFNYYLSKSIQYWHDIEVYRDEGMIDLIKERINMATEIKLDYIEKINKNSQF